MKVGASIKSKTVKQISGIPLTVYFCGECGSALCKDVGLEDTRGLKIIFADLLNGTDELLSKAPQSELWTKHELDWVGDVDEAGARQCNKFN